MKTRTNLTVRYAETDKMGIVHHSNYAVWFEAGRTDFLKQAGMSYSEVEARGIMMPLYGLSCRFRSPARYEDEITVVTSIKELTRVEITLYYEVIRERDGALLATGETMHAFTNNALKPLNVKRHLPDVYELLLKAQDSTADA